MLVISSGLVEALAILNSFRDLNVFEKVAGEPQQPPSTGATGTGNGKIVHIKKSKNAKNENSKKSKTPPCLSRMRCSPLNSISKRPRFQKRG